MELEQPPGFVPDAVHVSTKAGVPSPEDNDFTRAVVPALQEVWQKHGLTPLITSTTDGEHMDGSYHYTGQALDLRTKDIPSDKRKKVAEDLQAKLGPGSQVILEADHIHVEPSGLKDAVSEKKDVPAPVKLEAPQGFVADAPLQHPEGFVPDGAEPARPSMASQYGDFMADTLNPGKAGQELGRAISPVLQAAAPYLEKMRTPVVGLGGIAAGVKAGLRGQPIMAAAADSIEKRKGLGREVAEEVVGPGLGQEALTFGVELATDPLTYLAGPAAKMLSRIPEEIRGARMAADAAKLISASEEANAMRLGTPAYQRLRGSVLKAEGEYVLKTQAWVGEAEKDVAKAEAEVQALRGQAEAGASQKSPLPHLAGQKQKLSRALNEQQQALDAFLKRNPYNYSDAVKREYMQRSQGIQKTAQELQDLLAAKGGVPPAAGGPTSTELSALKQAEGRLSEAEFEAWKRKQLLNRKATITAAPGVEVEVAHPTQSAGVPLTGEAAAGAKAVWPQDIADASKLINAARISEGPAQEVVSEMLDNPKVVELLIAQKGGTVPLKETLSKGAALASKPGTLEKVAQLQPRQVLPKEKLAVQTAMAAALQNNSAIELSKLGDMRNAGVPLDQLAGIAATHFHGIIGAQGIISESGRALNAVRLTPAQRAAYKIALLATEEKIIENPARFSAFIDEIASLPKSSMTEHILATKKFVGGEGGYMAMFNEFRSASLLTRPVTFLRNMGGNALAVMSNLSERPLASYVDFLGDPLLKRLKGTSQEIAVGEGAANSYGMWRGLKNSARDALSALKSETSLSGFAADSALQTRAIPGVVGKAVRMPFRILNATDIFFKSLLAHGELARQAFRQAALGEGLTGLERANRIEELLAKPTESMLKSAYSAAKEFSYQDDLTGYFAKANALINDKSAAGALTKFQVPFFKTPVNIARFVIERTPLVSELTKRGLFRTAFLETGATRAMVAEAAARNIVGATAITSAALAAHYNEGLITGAAPTNPADRDSFFASGKRPYSINAFGIHIPYRGFEPIASYLSAVADWTQNQLDDIRDEHKATYAEQGGRITMSAIRNFVNQPFLKNMSDLLEAIESPDGSRVKKFIMADAESLIPQGLQSLSTGYSKPIKAPETIVEAMLSKTPYVGEWLATAVGSSTGEPKLTRFGEPIVRTTWAFGLADSPRPMTDPIERELRSRGIQKAVGFPSHYISGLGRKLSQKEYNTLLQDAGPLIRERVGMFINASGYKNFPDYAKLTQIRSIVEDTRREALDRQRPKTELRYLGISEKFDQDELYKINAHVSNPDYQNMKDAQRKASVLKLIADIKESRRGK